MYFKMAKLNSKIGNPRNQSLVGLTPDHRFTNDNFFSSLRRSLTSKMRVNFVSPKFVFDNTESLRNF